MPTPTLIRNHAHIQPRSAVIRGSGRVERALNTLPEPFPAHKVHIVAGRVLQNVAKQCQRLMHREDEGIGLLAALPADAFRTGRGTLFPLDGRANQKSVNAGEGMPSEPCGRKTGPHTQADGVGNDGVRAEPSLTPSGADAGSVSL